MGRGHATLYWGINDEAALKGLVLQSVRLRSWPMHYNWLNRSFWPVLLVQCIFEPSYSLPFIYIVGCDGNPLHGFANKTALPPQIISALRKKYGSQSPDLISSREGGITSSAPPPSSVLPTLLLSLLNRSVFSSSKVGKKNTKESKESSDINETKSSQSDVNPEESEKGDKEDEGESIENHLLSSLTLYLLLPILRVFFEAHVPIKPRMHTMMNLFNTY